MIYNRCWWLGWAAQHSYNHAAPAARSAASVLPTREAFQNINQTRPPSHSHQSHDTNIHPNFPNYPSKMHLVLTGLNCRIVEMSRLCCSLLQIRHGVSPAASPGWDWGPGPGEELVPGNNNTSTVHTVQTRAGPFLYRLSTCYVSHITQTPRHTMNSLCLRLRPLTNASASSFYRQASHTANNFHVTKYKYLLGLY